MPLDNAGWTTVVKKKYRTTALFDALDTAVKAYLKSGSNPTQLPQLAAKWHAWEKKFVSKGQDYRSSDRYEAGGALADVAALVASTPPMISSVATPVHGRTSVAPKAWVKAHLDSLMKCENYACNDVGTFSACIAPDIAVDKASEEYLRIRYPTIQSIGPPITSLDRSWRPKELARAYSAVDAKKAAECTNYAYYAAHVLTHGKNHPRVEIVTWEGEGTAKHLFCLVGRSGGTLPGFVVPSAETWNDDTVIVDCWALSLGWGECLYTRHNYCFDGMMSPLTVSMDSDIPWDGEADLVQSTLKSTGQRLW
ncbi:hypothetical protein [Rugamonas aquatica]|uniref:Uncharacterized protein n=1 Tax=Rugamonas aquatica TaxID=2743357 RepID=A0A6A7MV73_9BURK|nr:hypothetical protein [Rugamonas aquatica]MQA36911.1 hypothetical protein [Rugamonas aquatica]